MTRITMARLAWSEVRQHPTRYAATLAATALGVAFVVALLVFVPTQFRSIGVRATAQTAVADVVVTDVADAQHRLAAKVAWVDGVALAEPRSQTLAEFSADGRPGTIALSSLPRDPRLRWLDLDRGRWPVSPDELVIGAATAEAYHLEVGEPITVALADRLSGTASPARTQRTLRVVGITAEGHSLFAGSQATGAAPASLFAGDLATYPTVLALAMPGVSPEQLRDAIRAVVPEDASVRTSDQVATETMNQLSGGVQAGYLLLLVFGPIALLVGGLIITNTQLLVLTQRRRQLALLRSAGSGGSGWRSAARCC